MTSLQLLAHGGPEHVMSSWQQVFPLALTGAAFLLWLGFFGTGASSWSRDVVASVIRWMVVGLLFVAALAHVPVIPDHLDEAPYMGALFIAFAIASFGVAAMLAARPAPGWYVVAGLLTAAALVTYSATRLVAFPQLSDDVGAWSEPLGVVSVLCEAAALVLSVVALSRAHLSPATASRLRRQTTQMSG